MNRRSFLKVSSIFAAAIFVPSKGIAKTNIKFLNLHNIHTGEKLQVVYWQDGVYDKEALHAIEYFLRDYHNNNVHKIDVHLLDYLYDIYMLVDAKGAIDIISGYRSPKTNYALWKRHAGVSKKSYHTQGRAIDFRIPHIHLSTLHHAALSLRRGGVGYYPHSRFIHIDTGQVRSWRFPK